MDFPQTERTTLKRLPKRAVYDRELVYGILDEGFILSCGVLSRLPPLRDSDRLTLASKISSSSMARR